MHTVFILYLFLYVSSCQPSIISLTLVNHTGANIINNSQTNSLFSDAIYSHKWCCHTQLYVLELNSNTSQQLIEFKYEGSPLSSNNITFAVEKPGTPLPFVESITQFTTYKMIFVNSSCKKDIQDNNYWSKVDMTIFDTRVSFRLHCDVGGRHKNFEWGYVIIMIINSVIMIGVALHSRIWSITLAGNNALGIPIRWLWLFVFTVVVIGIGMVLLWVDSNTSMGSNIFGVTAEVVGDIIALLFAIINLTEIFFLFDRLKKKVYKFVRLCDILSVTVSLILVLLIASVPRLRENFLLNDILSIIISVGAIKLFKFLNLWNAIICCCVVFVEENALAVVMHYFYNHMSYNDIFGGTISSPLLMQVPILSYSLYQKCSWLPVSEIILPGITIAYLRRYDDSRDSKLYLIIGNTLFVFSTFLWILIQSLTVHSLPFALITYPFLFVPIMVMAYKRDELTTLLYGRFYDPQFLNYKQQKDMETDITNINENSLMQESTLRGLIPESEDLENSAKNLD